MRPKRRSHFNGPAARWEDLNSSAGTHCPRTFDLLAVVFKPLGDQPDFPRQPKAMLRFDGSDPDGVRFWRCFREIALRAHAGIVCPLTSPQIAQQTIFSSTSHLDGERTSGILCPPHGLVSRSDGGFRRAMDLA